MPPDLSDEQPHPPQVHRHQDQILAIPPREDIGLALDPTSQLNSRKHECTEEHQSEGTAKRTKLSGDNELPIDSSAKISLEEHRELHKALVDIRGEFAKKNQQLEAEFQAHETTKLKLDNVKRALTNATQDPAVKIGDLKTRAPGLNIRYINDDIELWTQRQAVEGQKEEYEATKHQLTKLKDQVDVQTQHVQLEYQQMEEKDQLIETYRRKLEDSKRELASSIEKFERSKRDRDAARKQIHDYQNALAKSQETLDTKQWELELITTKLKNAEREADALRLINDSNGTHNAKLQASADRAKSTLNKERKDYHSKKGLMDKEKAALEERIKGLRKEYKTKQDEWNSQTAKMVTEIREMRGKNHRYVNKIPDEKVRGCFNELRFKIVQFIDRFLEQLPEALDQKLETDWLALSPNAHKFLRSHLLYNLMCESYIWEWLRQTVFVPDSKVWAGELGTSLSQVLGMAHKQISGHEKGQEQLYADYQYWRSSSSDFLARLTEHKNDSESCRPAVNAMVMNLSKICDGIDVDTATTEALEIFNQARELDITLRTLKAEFSLGWAFGKSSSNNHLTQRYGFNFTDSTMIDPIRNPSNTAGAQVPTVDFIVSPALFKRGNNDGADYQTKTCCIKMAVVCNASNHLPQTNNLIDKRADVRQEQVGLSDSAQAIKKEEYMSEAVNHAPSPEKSLSLAKAGGSSGKKTQKRKRKLDEGEHVYIP